MSKATIDKTLNGKVLFRIQNEIKQLEFASRDVLGKAIDEHRDLNRNEINRLLGPARFIFYSLSMLNGRIKVANEENTEGRA